jgi:protein SCO1/2
MLNRNRNHRRPIKWRVPVLLGLAFVFAAVGGCKSSPKHYALRGRVLVKSSDQLTVNQENIPGFMPAMSMPYPVKDAGALAQVQSGDQITADLVVNGKKYWLQNVVVTGGGDGPAATATENGGPPPSTAIQPIEDESGFTMVGAELPDIPLTNQAGKTIHFGDFKGKTVLVTFIYTRCPFPTFCPLLSSEFASIQRELVKSPELYEKTHLVSVSLDPAYDTAPVLRKYGLGYLKNNPAGFAHWDFVSTKPKDLQTLAGAFGLTYFKQQNLLTHGMRTVLVKPNGTVASIWDGSEWRQPELLAAMRQATAGQ